MESDQTQQMGASEQAEEEGLAGDCGSGIAGVSPFTTPTIADFAHCFEAR